MDTGSHILYMDDNLTFVHELSDEELDAGPVKDGMNIIINAYSHAPGTDVRWANITQPDDYTPDEVRFDWVEAYGLITDE